MNNFISCGIFDKRFIYICLVNFFGIVIFGILFIFLIIFCSDDENLNNILMNRGLFQKNFLSYIGLSLCIIPELILKRKVKKENKDDHSILSKSYKKSRLIIKLIYNDYSDRITFRDRIYIVLFSFLLLIVDSLKAFLSYKQSVFDGGYNSLILIFLVVISIYIYNIPFYKHHYCCIIFIMIIELIKYIFKIIYFYSSNFELLDDILIQIIVGFAEAAVITYLKGLMEFKFFSPYKACYVFGFINTIITLILFFVVSYIPIKNGLVEYGDGENKNYYIDNIFFVFHNYNIKQMIIMFFMSIILGMFKLLINIISNYYTVCHIFILIQTEDFSQSVSQKIQTNSGGIWNIFLISFFGFLEFFITLVFLEIIEIGCFGLNKNTKKSIKKRAEEETKLLDNPDTELMNETLNSDID